MIKPTRNQTVFPLGFAGGPPWDDPSITNEWPKVFLVVQLAGGAQGKLKQNPKGTLDSCFAGGLPEQTPAYQKNSCRGQLAWQTQAKPKGFPGASLG